MFVYLCLGFLLSQSMAGEMGACEDFTTEPTCIAPCVWFVDEGEPECLEASELPASAQTGTGIAGTGNVGGITLKFCDKITAQTECFGYAVDPAEYEAGDPLVITEVGKDVTVCTWNPSLDVCTSAALGEGAAAAAQAGGMMQTGGMGFGEGAAFGEQPEMGEGFGPAAAFGEQPEMEQPEMGEGFGPAAGQNVATGDSGVTGSGTGMTNEEMNELVSQMAEKAVEIYSQMAEEQTSAGGTGPAQEAGEVEPVKAENYCPTITDPAKCTPPCVWATTQCMELDIVLKSNPLPEESNPLPEESSKIPVWKLATFAIMGLLIGVIVGTTYAHCRHKERNNDVFVPLDPQV